MDEAAKLVTFGDWRSRALESDDGPVQLANLTVEIRLGWVGKNDAHKMVFAIATVWDALRASGKAGPKEAGSTLRDVADNFPNLLLSGPPVNTATARFARLAKMKTQARSTGTYATAGQPISPNPKLARSHAPAHSAVEGARNRASNDHLRRRVEAPPARPRPRVVWVAPLEDIERNIYSGSSAEQRLRGIIDAGLPHLRGEEIIMEVYSDPRIPALLRKPTTLDAGGYSAYCGDRDDEGFGMTARLGTGERGIREAVFDGTGIYPEPGSVYLFQDSGDSPDQNREAILARLFETGCEPDCPSVPGWPGCGLEKLPAAECP